MTAGRQTLTSGEHERHLALSTLVQQGTYVWTTVVMLAVVTALARTFSLSAFGVYGLVVSFAAYLVVAQGAVEAAAIRLLAQAKDASDRDRAFSIAFLVYLVLGLLIGAIIAGVGNLLVDAFDIPRSLRGQARAGLLALGVITALGWPLKTFQDVLRGGQQFVMAATAEATAFLIFGLAMSVVLVAGAPLWVAIGLGGAVPALIGLVSAIAVMGSRLRVRYHHGSWRPGEIREFLGSSGLLFLTSLADLFIYSLDRVILGLFRPAATVGLYEGPVRAHNVVRQVQGVLSVTVLPAGARYIAEGDEDRVRDLIVRGTRYTLFATLPIVVVFMVLAGPILEVWLGAKFATAATAMTVLVGYWLAAANSNVAGIMLVAAGRMRVLATYAWAVAAANLALSLALTPSMGINGVVLGTSIPYVLSTPWLFWMVQRCLPVRISDLVHEAWVPAYSVAAGTAAMLVCLRLLLQPHTIVLVLALCASGLVAAWVAIYALCLHQAERRLVRDIWHVAWARIRTLLFRTSART